MLESRRLSVIIPAYNESLLIEKTLSELSEMTTQLVSRIIVVNDGSRDDTGNILERLSRTMPCLEVVEHPTNQGFGTSILTGLGRVTSSHVAWLPADGAIDPLALESVHLVDESSPIIFGFRNSHLAGKRRFVSRGVSEAIRLLFNVDLKNYSGFFVGKSDSLRLLNLQPQSIFLTWQVAIKAYGNIGSLRKSEVVVRSERNMARASRTFSMLNLVRGIFELVSLWIELKIPQKRTEDVRG
jgi:glycosyltransferase involved in cell wall biosynthesis